MNSFSRNKDVYGSSDGRGREGWNQRWITHYTYSVEQDECSHGRTFGAPTSKLLLIFMSFPDTTEHSNTYHLNIYWTSVTCIWSTLSTHHNNLYILLLFLSSSFFHIPERLKPCPSHSAISVFLSIPIPIKFFFSSLCFLIGKTSDYPIT